MKEQNTQQLLDNFFRQVLHYRNFSEVLSALGETQVSKSLDDIFRSFQQLISQATTQGKIFADSAENPNGKIDNLLSGKLPEKYKSDLQKLLQESKTTFNQLRETRFDPSKYFSDMRYYAQIVTILDSE